MRILPLSLATLGLALVSSSAFAQAVSDAPSAESAPSAGPSSASTTPTDSSEASGALPAVDPSSIPASTTSTDEPVVEPAREVRLPDEPPSADEATQRTLSTTQLATHPTFTFWRDGDSFIKPVIQIGASVVGYLPQSETTDTLANRVSTLALARFGLEGQLFGFVTFRSVFERNLGFSLSRNGPVGTSVWEGNASLQARENYVRLSQWGFALTGGIFPDPASLDFISVNTLDQFGMDPYVRDPLLVSGFGQGQGVMLRYGWEMLDFGVSYTAGNPLTTSLAFGFGGDVSSLGTLFTAPLRALSNGIPGSEIQLTTVSPSFTLHTDLVELRAAAQFYMVDPDVTTTTDANLEGYNLRASGQVNLLGNMLHVFGSFAYRHNQQIAVPDVTTYANDYEGFVGAGGFDFNYDRFSVGGQYYHLESKTSDTVSATNHYINVGATYWLEPPYVAIGFRWARSMADSEPTPPRLTTTDSLILSLRLLI